MKMLNYFFPLWAILLLTQTVYSQDFPSILGFSVDRGIYTGSGFDVDLTVDLPEATIKYTLDGSDPSTSATAKTASVPATVTINPENTAGRFTAPGVCLRAVGYAGSTQVTRIETFTYLFIDKVTSLSPDNVRPGTQWPPAGSSTNGQEINYGMDGQVYNNSRYRNRMVESLSAVPTFSIVTDLKNLFDRNTGIYVNASQRGENWERPASVELLYPDGREGFQINAGLRIRGGYSRITGNPKHAFRLYFRSIYGEGQLHYPLFGDEGVDEFDKIDLRTSQNYSWAFKGGGNGDSGKHNTMMREVFSRDSQRDMGMPYTRSRYYHLYLNGVYWGLFQTQERSEAAYAESYFGGDREDYDVIKRDPVTGPIEANDGNLDAWNYLWEVARRGFTSDEDYYMIQGLNPDGTRNPDYPVLVDMDNLICYMLCTFYTGDYDGPVSAFGGNDFTQNWFGIYNRIFPDGFKFFRHDGEHTMFLSEGAIPGAGIDRTGPYPAGQTRDKFNPQWLHQQLVNHPEYIIKFTDLVYLHFFNDGVFTPDAAAQRLQTRREQVETAIIAESARWGDSKVSTPRTYLNDWIPAVNFLFDEYVPVRTDMVVEQFRNKGWYPNVQPPVFKNGGFTLADGVLAQGSHVSIESDDGGVIYYTLDGTDPHLPSGQGGYNTYTLIAKNGSKYALVPEADIGSDWRLNSNYNVSGWQSVNGAPGGIGYEAGSGFEDFITLNVSSQMYDPNGVNPSANTSCYVRIPFFVSSDVLSDLTTLVFKSQFDDGIVVYLNGVGILAQNTPANPAWNSAAPSAVDSESEEKTFNVSAFIDKLVSGENLLAIHAMNVSRSSSDFLITASLEANDKTSGISVSGSAVRYGSAVPIQKSGLLKARVLDDTGWSALAQVQLWVLEDVRELRITEIHYHPLDDSEPDDNAEFEFIELKNMGSGLYDMSGMRFSDGINFTFPQGKILNGGKILVLAANADSFEKRYGFAPDGVYTGKLDNSGESLVLEQANGDTLMNIRYNDKYPWPKSADGEGYSMVVRDQLPGVDITDGANWIRSANIHGSPGEDEIFTRVERNREKAKIKTFQLFQNYPNPFNPSTTIRVYVAGDADIKLAVFNILGQEVARLVDGFFAAGSYDILWNAGNLAGGVYFYRLQAGDYVAVRKLILLK
ncbi:CotH kinase family protein [candidate division KSB1 bacterium]|nr:CotH kinase family protein [candidate division KSB1 bacterium]